MRYSLRNRDKIISKLGMPTWVVLSNSLRKHFEEHSSINTLQIEGEELPVISVQHISDPNRKIAFYVLAVRWDVYRLAFKGIY